MNISKSERLKKLPPYLFVEIDKAKQRAVEQGRDVIDLGIGDPDLPTPESIVEKLCEAVRDPRTHKYPSNDGMPELREAIAVWYKQRFGVELDPDKEVLPLIGSKEGIAHLPLAFINSSDISLVPSPSYPPYHRGTLLAGGKSYFLPLLKENGFLPDLKSIPSDILKAARLLFLNYPNNPTSATAGKAFFEEAVEFAQRNNILICHDAAYSEMAFDGYKPVSFLSADGAKEAGIEFHSLSKSCNMTGWRIGWVCGNSRAIECLKTVKANIDSGVFNAVQAAAVFALKDMKKFTGDMVKIYQERRDILVEGLRGAGFELEVPKATFYLWIKVPDGADSIGFAGRLLEKADIVATPGNGFGEAGEGYIRMALTVPAERLKEAVERIRGIQQ